MESYSGNAGSQVESELIDLGAISMTVLRQLDGVKFREALRRVLQQTSKQQVTVGGGGEGERLN